MREFLKSVLASAFGTLLAAFAGGALLLVIIMAIAGSSGDGRHAAVSMKPKSMLVIGGLAIDDTPEHGSPGFDSLLFGAEGPRLDLLRALEAIDLAAKDKQVAGILLSGGLDAGIAQKAELRRALAAFKASGKPVIAWLENASQGEYFLASVADKAYVHASGELEFKGLASFDFYFGETLRLLGLGVQVTKVGKYKSAVEPFVGGTMSVEAREQADALYGGLWKRVLGDVAKSRSLSPEALARAVDSAGVFSARKAVELKLADAALHRDELVDRVRKAGAAADETGTSFRQISLQRYARKVALPSRGGKIALIYAEGDIVDGWGGAYEAGGDRLAHHLRMVRGDEEFKAVVLRVNSPGGSAFASDVVAREVGLLRKKGVPVVVSMGDVAASGGYYIAARANVIMADPATITGSIGVFGLHLNYGELASKIRLGTDGVKTGKYADLLAEHRPATPAELAIVQASVDAVYEDFLRIVAEGRGLKRDDVHDIAQGRVWLGEDARGLKLVDKFGGLRDALREAKTLARLEEAAWVQVPALHAGRESFLQQLLADDEDETPLFAKATADPAVDFLRANARWLRSLRVLNDPQGVYLSCPLAPPAR
ncbi:MAG: signal peptide peptidase SppA [Verrucomicrobiota bacterium]